MKDALKISAVFIGLVIGAGFASGREIFEYFNRINPPGITGAVLAAMFFAIVSYIIMSYAEKRGLSDFNSLIDGVMPIGGSIVKIFMLFYMFCGLFVMFSGAGIMTERFLSLDRIWGIAVFALICFVVFSFDVKGVIAVNSVLVPIMLAGIVMVCVFSGTVETFADFDEIRRNPWISAACYVSYNTITAGAVLIPVAAKCPRRAIMRAAVMGGIIIGIVICLIQNAQAIYYNEVFTSEMPLLDIATRYGHIAETAYACIILMALLTTAVSYGFGILGKLKLKKQRERVIAAFVLCAAAVPFARADFSELVEKLYFVFGVAGILWLGMLLAAYVRVSP